MFLSAYHLDGPTDRILAGFEQLEAQYPTGPQDLRVCVVREGGITVYDSCPTREEFEQFSTSAEFRSAVANAGLPNPRIEPLGEIHIAQAAAVAS